MKGDSAGQVENSSAITSKSDENTHSTRSQPIQADLKTDRRQDLLKHLPCKTCEWRSNSVLPDPPDLLNGVFFEMNYRDEVHVSQVEREESRRLDRSPCNV